MRLAIAIQRYGPVIGGAERQAALLAEVASRRLERCDVVTTKVRGDLPTRCRQGDVTILRLPTIRHARLWVWANFAVSLAYFLLCAHRYTIIHINNLSPFSLGALLGAKVWRRPVVLKIAAIGALGDIAKVRE